MSGECDACGEHAMECRCDNQRSDSPHWCEYRFSQRAVDERSEIVFDRCHGTDVMILETHFPSQDGTETSCDDWTVRRVAYCPFCGLKSEGSYGNP